MSSQHGVINGGDVVASAPDPSLSVLTSSEVDTRCFEDATVTIEYVSGVIEAPSTIPDGNRLIYCSYCGSIGAQDAAPLLSLPGAMRVCGLCGGGQGRQPVRFNQSDEGTNVPSFRDMLRDSGFDNPPAIDGLDAEVLAENIEMTAYPDLPDLVITVRGITNSVQELSLSPGSVHADPPPTPTALPPGSICETCWDQPATQLLPAPWGGDMGVCVWCAKGEGEEAVDPDLPVGITVGEARAIVETLLTDAMHRCLPTMIAARQVLAPRRGGSFGEAREAFSRIGEALRTFHDVHLDDLVIDHSVLDDL